MARRKLKLGKFVGQTLLTAIIAAVILIFVGWLISLVTPLAGIWGNILVIVVSALFFIQAAKINPGDEKFSVYFPKLVLALGVIEFISLLGLTIPGLMPFSVVGLAFGFGSTFLANSLTRKYITK